MPYNYIRSSDENNSSDNFKMSQNPSEQQENRNQPLDDPRPVVKRFLDVYTAFEAWRLGLLGRSPSEFSQGSTLTDIQFNAPPHQWLFDESKGSDSSQIVYQTDRLDDPVNDLGSRNSLTSEICNANFDYDNVDLDTSSSQQDYELPEEQESPLSYPSYLSLSDPGSDYAYFDDFKDNEK